MNARRHSCPSTTSERGIALLTTILMMVLMSALLVGFTTAVMSDQTNRTIDRDRARAFYGAQSGIEKQNADLARLFINQAGPPDSAIIALGAAANQPTIPNVTFVTTGASPAYAVTPIPPVPPSTGAGIIAAGPYEGLMGLKRQVQLDATARSIDGGEVHLRRLVEAVAIPVFQFGIFSDVDLAFNAAGAFDFGGRVHTNRNLFLAEGSGSTLWLREKVSAVGEVIRTELSNGATLASAGQTGTVNMTRGNATGPFRHIQTSEGSVVGGPTSALNGSWATVSLSTYVGNIRNSRTGVKPLNLDLIAANGANIDLIKRPAPGEGAGSAIFAERYFKKVSVRILLSDTAADITNLPTVSVTAPISLDGDWNAAPPLGYAPIGANRPPVARSGWTQAQLLPLGSGVMAAVVANAVTINMVSNAMLIPDAFRLPVVPLTLTYGAVPATFNVTCTGKTATTFTGCTKALAGTIVLTAPVSVAVLVPTAEGGRNAATPINNFTWNNGATVTLTATAGAGPLATLPFTALNTFFARDKNILVTCTGYNTVPAPDQLTGCIVPNAISVNDTMTTGYLTPAGTGTVGGFLKVEIQTAPDVWQDVTMEFLRYGISGPNRSGRLCGDPTTDAIIRLQRLRDNNEPTAPPGLCSYFGSTASTDHWPNVLHDVREGLSRDAAPAAHANRVVLGGVMHYVMLDARNLSRWFTRQGVYAAGTGNLAMREGGAPTAGYSVYFSDRRNNRNLTNLETGEYGYEDVVNPASATGAPNGALDLGEDVNANAVLDDYGRFPSSNGVSNTVPLGSIAPMDITARPETLVSGGQAKVNRALHFRHALKVVNGGIGNLVAPGLTIAAENAVYLEGDWNASVAGGWTGASVATSIAADTVVALSNDWNDLNSFGPTANLNPYDITARPRSANTYYRLALISGKGRIFPRPASGGGTYGTDGGAHNFVRFIEGNNGANTVWYQGSMVTFYYARQNLMPHKCCNDIIYGVPQRQYLFDVNFLNPSLLPPLTPAFRDINALGFTQETRPGR